jgi:hypothetical protein
VGALVVRGDLERRPGSGRGLLEDERDVEPGEHAGPLAHVPFHPQLRAQVDQVTEFRGGEVDLLEQAASVQVDPGQVHGFAPWAEAGS